MKTPKILSRIGIFITVLGLSIFLVNLTVGFRVRNISFHMNFEVSANGKFVQVQILKNLPYEIRILALEDFNGTFCIFNYEGIKKLTEGINTPIFQQTLNGSTLIDFTPDRRGAYLFLIENKLNSTVSGAIGLVEIGAISQDLLVDSSIITLSGLAITLIATVPKSLKRDKPQAKTQK